MSILLSAYYPEGIVFAADKNATIIGVPSGRKHVEPTATKVLEWPHQKAIVGYVGLGRLASKLALDDWMRIFIVETRDLDDLDKIAHNLRDRIQEDFDKDYPLGSDVSRAHLVVHFGGYVDRGGVLTPVMYHIWNHGDIDPQTGYPPADRDFRISEDIERDFEAHVDPPKYPKGVRAWLESKVREGQFKWYNNGAHLAAFNTFKGVLWSSIAALQSAGFVPAATLLEQRVAFCKMAVEVFGSFYTHYYPPEDRAVGGGVDAVFLPWP